MTTVTNYINYSQQINQWIGLNTTVDTGISDPNGGTDAQRINFNASGSYRIIDANTTINTGESATGSIWVRNPTSTAASIGVARKVGIGSFERTLLAVPLTSQWTRIEVTHTYANNQSGSRFDILSNSGSIEVFGAQLEYNVPQASNYYVLTTTDAPRTVDLATLTSGWGGKTWGASDWGDLSDETVVVSSVAAQTSVGNFVTLGDANVDVNGLSATLINQGAVGGTSALIVPETLSLNADLGQIISGICVVTTGSSATVNVGNETEAFNLDGWGGSAWGEFAWGIGGTLLVSGVQATTSAGSVTIEADGKAEPSTVSAIATAGQSDSRIDVNLTAEGSALQTFVGNEDTEGEGTVTATGSSATANPGQATIDPTFLVGEGWGRDTFGNLGWGVNYSVIAAGPNGLSASIVTGNEDAFTDVVAEVETAGELQTAITPVGTKADSDTEIAVGELISTGIGDVTVTGTANFELTGIDLQTAIGESVGGTIQEVPVTGVAANIFIGNEDTAANANVFPTGISVSTNIGQAEYIATYDVSGVSLSANTGQITAEGTAVVIPTGIGLTVNTVSPNIVAWAEVDTGTEVIWSEVDLAA